MVVIEDTVGCDLLISETFGMLMMLNGQAVGCQPTVRSFDKVHGSHERYYELQDVVGCGCLKYSECISC